MDNPTIDNAESVKNPSPFITFTARTIPATFDTSMSYQEALFALVNYLQTQVTPAINENAHITDEQTKAINELYDFVNHYFDNLDVQEEINNKLDEMAESGVLTDIIAQYLQLAGVLAYNTIADMSDAQNIESGSICYTLGQTVYNDGKGAFYKIRQITSEDTVDGFNIVSLDVSNTLIAERIPDYRMNQAETAITNIENTLISRRRRIILIGDSYAQNDRDITGWQDKVTTYLTNSGFTFIKLKKGGMGFKREADGINVETLLSNASGSIDNKNTVTDIIVALGYNDQSYSQADIEAKVQSFCTYCKTNYPNANIQIGMIGWTSNNGTDGNISNLRKVRNAYANAGLYGGCYMKDIEYTLHNYIEDFYSDNFHPSEIGTTKIAKNIINFIFGIPCTNNIEFRSAYNNKIYESQQNNRCNVFVYNDCQINVNIASFVCDGNTSYELDNMTPVCVNGTAEGGGNFKGSLIVHSTSNGYYEVEANIIFGKKIIVRPKKLASTNAWLTIPNVNWVMLNMNNWSIPTEDC